MKEMLIENIEKIHTTKLGSERIKRNINCDEDVIEFTKKCILSNNANIYKKGKNYYCETKNVIITINSYSYTIITAHKKKQNIFI